MLCITYIINVYTDVSIVHKIYIYQGWAVSVRVVLACGVSCCHLLCRAVIDALAC